MESLRSLSIKIFKTALSMANAYQAVLEHLSLKGNILRIKDGSSSFQEFDSYTFFKKAGGLLMTGPTGTNVMDLHILLVK